MIDATEISQDSQFSIELRKIIQEKQPKIVLESGTYKGCGSSRIILDALGQLDGPRDFYTIEVNKDFGSEATKNLNINRPSNVNVYCLNGLSIPRLNLPEPDAVQIIVDEAKKAGVQVDHNGKDEVMYYMKETSISSTTEDRLLDGILDLDPDLILLDSGGHVGEIEFLYVIMRIHKPCVICLDDTRHIKHYKSLQRMKDDDRFFIRIESSEKFGFSIAEFTP